MNGGSSEIFLLSGNNCENASTYHFNIVSYRIRCTEIKVEA